MPRQKLYLSNDGQTRTKTVVLGVLIETALRRWYSIRQILLILRAFHWLRHLLNETTLYNIRRGQNLGLRSPFYHT